MKNDELILIAEDENSLARGLEFNLSSEGYDVILASDGKETLKQLKEHKFDLVILDIMLPFVDGFDIAKYIREEDLQLPILFLTARGGIKDKLKGLELGADDYMTKPFHLEELLLKVKGMLRRKAWYKNASQTIPTFSFGGFTINFNSLIYQSPEGEITLTLHEAMLLKYLIEHKGIVISRKELLEQVWNTNSDIETRTVDNFVVRLRKHFETDPENPLFIKSVRGVGYLFVDNERD
jgi:DNA-binding response OmpR family regulator